MGVIKSLRRFATRMKSQEDAMVIGRWLSIVFAVLQAIFYQPPPMMNLPPWGALVLMLPLLVVNIVQVRFGRELARRWGTVWWVGQFTVDVVVSLAVITLYYSDPQAPMWAVVCLPLLNAALRLGLRGAVLAWIALAVTYSVWDAVMQRNPLSPVTGGLVTYRLGILGIIALATGMLASGLAQRIEQIDALGSVSSVTQKMSDMDQATLTREVIRAATQIGFSDVTMYNMVSEHGWWECFSTTGQPDEDPQDTHAWCRDIAARIGDRSYPVFLRPEDSLTTFQSLSSHRQLVVTPVRSGPDLTALVVASHPEPTPSFRLRTLQLLAAHAGAALANARRYAERERFERKLAHQATHDALTGLPNRVLLHERMGHALNRARADGSVTAILLLDLDRFKEINDTLGHAYGDALLVQVAGRLTETLRAGDMAARLGGDEFAVLATGIEDVQDAVGIARRVLAGVHRPFLVDGVTLDVEVSIGVAVAPDHGTDGDDLLRCADVAMYDAKNATLGVAAYDPAHDMHTPRRLALLGDLRRALEVEDQMTLYYQPAVGVLRGPLIGAEALLRWVHPVHGLVPPSQFVPGAEGTGLIHRLTTEVLSQAMSQAARWSAHGFPIPIAVNLSTRCLMDLHLPDQVRELLAEHLVSPGLIRMEITESSIMADPTRAIGVLRRLADLGVKLSIDDFGTGYSSMSYLKHLPVDEIKIDRSFVQDMHQQSQDALLVRSLIELGHNLGLRVVAEGVEDGETLTGLAKLGCDVAQGFYIGRPMPAARFEQWVVDGYVGKGAARPA